jgi:hypothetical protein
MEEPVHELAVVGGVLAWCVNTLASAILGIVVGFMVVAVVSRLPFGSHGHGEADHVEGHDEASHGDSHDEDASQPNPPA